jgi:hypothetical protein
MKNFDAQQAETTLSDHELGQATGGGYTTIIKASSRAPVVTKSNGPVFPGVDFDYPKKPINPRDIR